MNQKQKYDFFFVLDFEATCQEGHPIDNQEIIEFPVLKISGKTFDIVDQFHHYVRPISNSQLTDFCTQLTGISQQMVNESESFPDVFNNFQSWVSRTTPADQSFLFVTCGDWDLKKMLPEQCKREKIDIPPYFRTWMNIKKTYAHVTGNFVKGMMPMLKELNLKHVGRHHSGIDDCINIAHILEKLAEFGTVFGSTSVRKDERKLKKFQKNHQSPTTEQSESVVPDLNDLSSSFEKDCSHIYPSLSLYEEGQAAAVDQPDGAIGGVDSILDTLDVEEADSILDTRDVEEAEEASPESLSSTINYEAIISRLRDNMSSPKLKSRDVAELPSLLAAAKYLSSMETCDRTILENRLRYFYVGLCHGWRVADKDAKSISTDSVGIHIQPQILGRRERKSQRKTHKYKTAAPPF